MKWTVTIVAVVAGVIGLCRVEDVLAATDIAVCAKVISDNEIAKSPDSVIEACSLS
jgi:hypothetical protein